MILNYPTGIFNYVDYKIKNCLRFGNLRQTETYAPDGIDIIIIRVFLDLGSDIAYVNINGLVFTDVHVIPRVFVDLALLENLAGILEKQL